MNRPSFSLIIIAIYAGFNALLLTVIGLLMTFSRPGAGPAGWGMACGLVLLTVGVLIGAAIYGLLARREWGRKVASGGLLFCIPLNLVAIFPILQNHRMTIGNTVLQIACMAASIASILYLTRKHDAGSRLEETRPEGASVEANQPIPEEEGEFTFDRHGHADRLPADGE